MVKEYHEVFDSAAGSHGEATSLVCWIFFCEFDSFEEDSMTSDLGFNWVRGQGSCRSHSSFCGRDILPILSHVPFGGGKILGEVLADER